jgi:uncharacterized FlaG/YvyC family protein
MDVSAANRIMQALPAAATTIPAYEATQGREVVQAVKALNQTEMFGQDNELEFQRDPASRRMVVRIVNRKTQELVAQVPPEYVLRLAENLKTP